MKTDVYVDGARLDIEDDGGGSTLAQLVLAVDREIKGLRRYVDNVSVDGEQMHEWRDSEAMDLPLCSHREVRLTTVCFDEVAFHGLDTLREYAGVIRRNIPACVDSLRRGEPAGAALSTIVEGAVEVVKTVGALVRGGGHYGLGVFDSDPAPSCSSLMERIESLGEAGENRDSVSIADILEYEVAPILEEMEEIFRPAGA
ncbi:MAG: hypothetical protein ACE5GY_05310 [Thermodesulfobacteriota bacterium]